MKEIRIHGRGGQGSLVLAQFMAIAALEDEKYGQAFPFLAAASAAASPLWLFAVSAIVPFEFAAELPSPIMSLFRMRRF